ncbi:hypothetical protein E8E13_007007 [Curvularia kusanoi]|uniref:Heterokaryon incompatibility domain-containing protein n=1 Tax=Curvularia kusanoi TaxID=90978 RepID=A0A9P4TND5_CURKU|nr:hypothetical protein E8E13_007007 [Curvularia kusanoi]
MSRVDEAFIYVPLQPGQIRLLLPHIQADGRVHWSLANEQFLDPSGNRTSLEYDALSYTWGDSTPNATKFPVVCNDQQMLVHHNLNTALPFLARRDSPLPIWIDAVCINQFDEDEKYHQIQMMFQIYRCAAQVWVWLGPGNDQSGTVVARLHELPIATDNDNKSETMFFEDEQNVPWLDSSETWSTFYDLVDNAWYTRLWVFQEVAFAKKEIPNYNDNDSIKAAYWDTLNTSLSNARAPSVVFQTVNDLKNSWEQNAHQVETLALLDEIPFAANPNLEVMPGLRNFMTGAFRVSALMDDQRLFTTTSGRIGHAFPNVSLGDQICIFSDARVVHIVRPKPSAHTYELVGPAYVHGMMHGEIAKLDIVEQDVTLV